MSKKVSNLEIRYFGGLRLAAPESRTIEGYAIVTGQRSQLLEGMFYETIDPAALSQDFLNTQSIRVLYDHNDNMPSLARFNRGKGTLRLSVDEGGMKFEFNAPKTSHGDEVLDAVRRGDITECSFAFTTKTDEWAERADGYFDRTVKEFGNIFEISLLDVDAAYPTTSVAARSLDEWRKKREAEDEDPKDEDPKDEDPKDDETNSKRDGEEDPKDEEPKDGDDPKDDEETNSKRDGEDDEPKDGEDPQDEPKDEDETNSKRDGEDDEPKDDEPKDDDSDRDDEDEDPKDDDPQDEPKDDEEEKKRDLANYFAELRSILNK